MEAKGIVFHKQSHMKRIERSPTDSTALLVTLTVGPNDEEQTLEVDQVLFAIGRKAMTDGLSLEELGIATNAKGDIQTDAFERTTVEGVYAVGDCTGKRLLTPVALAAGRRLSGRLFGPAHLRELKLDYDFIPSVIFSHPPVGSVGLTEAEARETHGEANVRCHTTAFGALAYKMMESVESEQPTAFKVCRSEWCLLFLGCSSLSVFLQIICVGETERVVGLHIVGGGSDEMLQGQSLLHPSRTALNAKADRSDDAVGFAVAIKLGATMRDLLDTVALHPTRSVEHLERPTSSCRC